MIIPMTSAAHHMMNAAPEAMSFIFAMRRCSSGVTWSQISSIAVLNASTASIAPLVRMTTNNSRREIFSQNEAMIVRMPLTLSILKLYSSRQSVRIARTDGRIFCTFFLKDIFIVYSKFTATMIFLIALAAFCATFLGGWFALHLKDRLHLILGFSAGAVIGVAFFELLPEAISLVGETHSPDYVTSIIALGFALYLVLDRLIILHRHHEDPSHEHASAMRGAWGAGTLSLHSFLDGVGIGLAFKVSPAIGFVVAAAVLAHDFSDGINTVNMILKNGGERAKALRWLAVDALAPLLGVVATLFFSVTEQNLGILIALFAGFFLYIGASDLLPESHHAHPMRWTTISTVAGMAFIYLIIKSAGA